MPVLLSKPAGFQHGGTRPRRWRDYCTALNGRSATLRIACAAALGEPSLKKGRWRSEVLIWMICESTVASVTCSSPGGDEVLVLLPRAVEEAAGSNHTGVRSA